jgi:hypothetical protein
MTDEEAAALDDRWTKTIPKVNPARPGVFARQRALLETLDHLSATISFTNGTLFWYS